MGESRNSSIDASSSRSSSLDDSFDEEAVAHHQLFLLYEKNHSLHEPWFNLFSLAYGVLILLTFLGNSLVVLAVARKKAMWSARNIFILNLALSGLILCVTMILTAVDVLSKYWPFGQDSLTLCRVVKSSPCFAVYLSSFTIVIIALDRYRYIVESSKPQLSTKQAVLALPFLYILSVLTACPIFIHTHLHIPEVSKRHQEQKQQQQQQMQYEEDEEDYLSHLVFCIEDWNYQGNANTSKIQRESKRHVYSLFSLFVQYIIPFLLIAVVYTLIYTYLKQHRIVRPDTSMRQRARRTNIMLFSISLLYCFCWLPLNFFNVAVDIWDPFKSHTQLMIGLFICCHLVGMSSACINPILYGYLNESFKVQFIEIASCLLCGKKSASNLPLAHRKPSTAKQDRNREEESKQRLTPSPPPGGNELLSISPDIKKKSGETFVIVTADRNGGGKSSAAAVLKSAAAPPSKYSPGRADQTFV